MHPHGSIQWGNVLIFELSFILLVMMGLGFIKVPRFLMRKRLAKGFPWGYYRDQVPKTDRGYYDEHDQDFLHDLGTEFGGIKGFGDYGEFSGFGELGEFGNTFFSGGE